MVFVTRPPSRLILSDSEAILYFVVVVVMVIHWKRAKKNQSVPANRYFPHTLIENLSFCLLECVYRLRIDINLYVTEKYVSKQGFERKSLPNEFCIYIVCIHEERMNKI